MKNERVQFFITNEQIQMYLDGDSYTVYAKNPEGYDEVYRLLTNFTEWENDWEVDIFIDNLLEIVDKKTQFMEFLDSNGSPITIEDGLIKYNSMVLKSTIVDRLQEIVINDGDPNAIVNFIENLMQNPSPTSVNELYLFLEYNTLPITEDGHFLAYKKIRNDWTDIHSGTIDNSPGEIIQMYRDCVDPNRERTCSYGFHVCAYDYLSHFGSVSNDDDRVVMVKVNPKNVVTVPSYYDNAKMRVSEYRVIEEVEDWQNYKIRDYYVGYDNDMYESWNEYKANITKPEVERTQIDTDDDFYPEEDDNAWIENDYRLTVENGRTFLENFSSHEKVRWSHAGRRYVGFILGEILPDEHVGVAIDNLLDHGDEFIDNFDYKKKIRHKVSNHKRYLIACTERDSEVFETPILLTPSVDRVNDISF